MSRQPFDAEAFEQLTTQIQRSVEERRRRRAATPEPIWQDFTARLRRNDHAMRHLRSVLGGLAGASPDDRLAADVKRYLVAVRQASVSLRDLKASTQHRNPWR